MAMKDQTVIVQLWLLTLTKPILVFNYGQARLKKGKSGKFDPIQLKSHQVFTLLIEQDNEQSLLIDEVRRASQKKISEIKYWYTYASLPAR